MCSSVAIPTTYSRTFKYLPEIFLKSSEVTSFCSADFGACNYSPCWDDNSDSLLKDSACAIQLIETEELPSADLTLQVEKAASFILYIKNV